MPTLLLSAPDIVAAGGCVETGSISWYTRPVTSAIVWLVCSKEATYDIGDRGLRREMEL